HSSCPPPNLPSFPTRRSSDLEGEGVDRLGLLRQVDHRPEDHLVGGAVEVRGLQVLDGDEGGGVVEEDAAEHRLLRLQGLRRHPPDRKSTRLNSSHVAISYAVF